MITCGLPGPHIPFIAEPPRRWRDLCPKNLPQALRPTPDIVVEKVTFKWAHFYNKEDSWAIWLGFALLAIGLLIFLPRPPAGAEQIIAEANAVMQAESEQAPFKTVGWYDALSKKQGLKATNESYAKTIARWLHQPHSWSTNPIESFVLSADGAEARNMPHREQYETPPKPPLRQQKQQPSPPSERPQRPATTMLPSTTSRWRTFAPGAPQRTVNQPSKRRQPSNHITNSVTWLASVSSWRSFLASAHAFSTILFRNSQPPSRLSLSWRFSRT